MSGLAETSAEAGTERKLASGSTRKPVSVTVVAHNEAKRIRACIDSVSWADEIIVIDAGSSDGTREICQKRGALVLQHPWQGYAAQKNFAISKASHSWILSLDADERVSPELAKEILSVLSDDAPVSGYRIPRKNIFFGRWLRHGDLWPDYQIRLFRRDAGVFREKSVHESVAVQGRVDVFSSPLEHYSYDSLFDFFQRQVKYARLSAEDLFSRGARPGIGDFVIRPLWRFFKSYILKMGLRDGVNGLWVSVGSACYVFMRAAFYGSYVGNVNALSVADTETSPVMGGRGNRILLGPTAHIECGRKVLPTGRPNGELKTTEAGVAFEPAWTTPEFCLEGNPG